MSSRSALTRSALAAALLAGFAFSASAQTKVPADASAKGKSATESAFASADANNDGKLSKEEAARLPAIAAKFDQLDKDKKGYLTLEEFAAGYTAAK